MAIRILMPALSPTMDEGTLARWLVQEGDAVSAGDVIAEIETDKATMEYEAIDDGTLGKILVAEGTEGVKVNAPIAILVEEGEDAAEAVAKAMAGGDAAPDAAGGESGDDARASASEPATASANAPAAPAGPEPATASGQRIFASPLARRIARDRGLDLATIRGSGPRGRIVKADVEAARATAPAPTAAATATAPPAGPATETLLKIYEDREFTEMPLDGMRRTVAARLTEAKQTIPHFYLRRSIRLDALLNMRRELNEALAARDVKLSVNDFIIKASAIALQSVPDANAIWAGDRILKFKASDIAVAVAVEGGLFTPVIRDADQKSLSALSTEMKDLAARARSKRLAPHEYQGGSFAISNLGMYGIENFDAVINPPHGAILAVGAGMKKPFVDEDGTLGVATLMSVTLSVDHRVIDGALGAEFLAAFKNGLENPLTMLA